MIWRSVIEVIQLMSLCKCLQNDVGEKGRDLTQSYDKNPYVNRKYKKQNDSTKTPPKTSIT